MPNKDLEEQQVGQVTSRPPNYLQHEKYLMKALSSDDGDCTIVTIDGHVKCHRLILAAVSPFFKRELQVSSIIPLLEYNVSEIQVIRRLMYTGEADIDVNMGNAKKFQNLIELFELPNISPNVMKSLKDLSDAGMKLQDEGIAESQPIHDEPAVNPEEPALNPDKPALNPEQPTFISKKPAVKKPAVKKPAVKKPAVKKPGTSTQKPSDNQKLQQAKRATRASVSKIPVKKPAAPLKEKTSKQPAKSNNLKMSFELLCCPICTVPCASSDEQLKSHIERAHCSFRRRASTF